MHAAQNSPRIHGPVFQAVRFGMGAALLATLLGACASTRELPPQEARIVAPVDAMIIPPPGGPAIVNVVSTTYPNAIKQDISLATQARSVGENKISLIQFVAKGGDGSGSELRDIPFTQVNLTEEALKAWPNTGMAVSPYYVQNDYGPFGYAIGRPPNGDTCIYAWQRIEPSLRPSGAVERGAISIRLQLCKRGASEQELVEVMYRLRLNSSVHAPRSAPPAIGRIHNSIRPVGAQGFANVIDVPAPRAPSRPAAVVQAVAAPAPTPVPVAQPVAITPPPGAPIVPSPGGTGGTSGSGVPRSSGSPAVLVPSPTGRGQ